MEKKHSKAPIIIIIILILLFIVCGGYVYLEKNKYEQKITKLQAKINTQTKTKSTNLVSEKEALELGKEKYLYIRDGLLICGFKSLTLSTETYSYDNTTKTAKQVSGGEYSKITNIQTIKENLTTNAFYTWINSSSINPVRDNEGNYYITNSCGEDTSFAKDKYQISVSKIESDQIIYKVKEYYYKSLEGDYENTPDNLEEFDTTFVLIKENSTWKIASFLDPYYYYEETQS